MLPKDKHGVTTNFNVLNTNRGHGLEKTMYAHTFSRKKLPVWSKQTFE